jgi:hypothetical protein
MLVWEFDGVSGMCLAMRENGAHHRRFRRFPRQVSKTNTQCASTKASNHRRRPYCQKQSGKQERAGKQRRAQNFWYPKCFLLSLTMDGGSAPAQRKQCQLRASFHASFISWPEQQKPRYAVRCRSQVQFTPTHMYVCSNKNAQAHVVSCAGQQGSLVCHDDLERGGGMDTSARWQRYCKGRARHIPWTWA